jgi:hypothetical protein
MLAVVGAVAFVELRRGGANPQDTSAAAASGNSTAETHSPFNAIDAMPATATLPTPEAGNVETVVTARPDGGVADAPSVTDAIDAAVRPPHRSKPGGKGPRQPSRRGDHASSTGSAAPPIIDRGD